MVAVTKQTLIYVREQALKAASSSNRKEDMGFGPLSESEWLTLCWIRAVQAAQGSNFDELFPNKNCADWYKMAGMGLVPTFDTTPKHFDISSVNDE